MVSLISSCFQTHALNRILHIPDIRTLSDFYRDNEYGNRSYEVPAFQAAKYKTTNGEFWEFVCDGGYGKSDLWTDAGNPTLSTVTADCSFHTLRQTP